MDIIDSPDADGSGSIVLGGTAQNIFIVGTSAVIPANGYSIENVDTANDLWVSHSGTASPNGSGSRRIPPNGGYYATEPGQRPTGIVSIYGAITGQKFTASRW